MHCVTMYEGCSEIIETLAVNKLLKKLQVLFFGRVCSKAYLLIEFKLLNV